MGVYDRQRASALRIIAAKGEVCDWSQTGDSIADPDKPWEETDSVPVVYQGIRIAFFPLGANDLETVKLLLKTEIPTGLEMGYMGNVPFEPDLKDLVVRRNGKKMRIVTVGKIDPNGEGAVLYQVVVRE